MPRGIIYYKRMDQFFENTLNLLVGFGETLKIFFETLAFSIPQFIEITLNLLVGFGDDPSHVEHALGIGDGGAAKFLYDKSHVI